MVATYLEFWAICATRWIEQTLEETQGCSHEWHAVGLGGYEGQWQCNGKRGQTEGLGPMNCNDVNIFPMKSLAGLVKIPDISGCLFRQPLLFAAFDKCKWYAYVSTSSSYISTYFTIFSLTRSSFTYLIELHTWKGKRLSHLELIGAHLVHRHVN